MSIERLAEITGIGAAQIAKYEHGTERISAVDLRQLALALDASVSSFFEVVRASVGAANRPANSELPLSDEALELVRAFARVRDPVARRRIIDLAIMLGSSADVGPTGTQA